MKQVKGFTLLEVMITVAIVAILAGIAYPSYLSHVQSTKREEGKRTLVEAAQHMESYYAMHLNYSGAVSSASLNFYTPSNDFGEIYTLTAVANSTGTSYTLTATPKGSQSGDSCGPLTISSTGATTPASGGCW
ncbi:type IV pilin protein [Agarivorans sp. 1_MG-2023]|uniref:type IV pilin protein n=1 Tax=Agarivorans sp. 1_MG-2023 TaxID=3062634 RepID=UPI0026E1CDA2|nr:type IV pilin protein [Agarivorans sp. 1_MG-2023]MDO6763461.1 type IV pilin protein [Agarivorans sp. 1_MG-2023]